MTFPESFPTARLLAERLTADHESDIHEMHQDPLLMASLGGVRDAGQTAAYLAHNLRHWGQHGFGVWLLRDAATHAVAGRALLRYLPMAGREEVEVGYALRPAWWGRGLATEIAGACLTYARTALGLASVVALTLPDNLRSRRVLAKIGMVPEREVTHAGLPHLLYRTPPSEGARDL